MWHRTFRSLTERNYRRYFAGHACSVIGTWMQRIGQDWLVLELTDSALAIGGALLCQFLPVLVGGVWGGVVVDRVDTRRLIMATQVVQAVLAGILALFALTGTATLVIVYLLALGLGVVTVFDVPARQSFVSELVEDDDIVNAQSLNSLINNVGRLVGPAIAGVLIALTGVGVTFVINAFSFLAVLVGLRMMDVGSLRKVPITVRAPGQAREGLRYVWHHNELRATVLLVTVIAVFGQNFRVVFPVLASDAFDSGAQAYGWLTAMLGLGAVMGGLVVAASTRPTSWWLLMACVAFGVMNLVVAVAPTLPIAMGAVVVLGMTNIAVNALARTVLQVRAVPGMRGRVMAIHALVFLGGIPIGGPLMGLLCELWGARVGMAIGGGMCLLGAAVLLPRLRKLRSTR